MDAPFPCRGGIHTSVPVLRGHHGYLVHLYRGVFRQIWSKSMNLGGIFEEVLDGSQFVFLFSSRYDSSLLLSYLGRKNNHEDNSNPNLIHLIFNHVHDLP
jgi:hypothetical protein